MLFNKLLDFHWLSDNMQLCCSPPHKDMFMFYFLFFCPLFLKMIRIALIQFMLLISFFDREAATFMQEVFQFITCLNISRYMRYFPFQVFSYATGPRFDYSSFLITGTCRFGLAVLSWSSS